MPKKSWPLWLGFCLLIVGFPTLSYIYFDALLRSGTLPPHSDSIAIPIFGNLIVTVIATPFLAGITWSCLRNYNSEARLFVWRNDRPFRSVLATLVFGAVASYFAGIMLDALRPNLPWFEWLWAPYFGLWVMFAFFLRSSVIEQLPSVPAE